MVKMARIIFKRHRWLIVLSILAMAIILFFTVQSHVEQYHESTQGLMSEKTFNKEKRKKDSDASDYKTYERYLQYNVNVYSLYDDNSAVLHSDIKKPIPESVYAPNIVWLAVTLAIGVLLTWMDSFGNFDRFLFSLGKRRGSVFKTRFTLFAVLVGGLSLLIVGGDLVFTAMLVPTKYATLPALIATSIIGYNLVLSLAAFSTGYLLGTLIGRPIVLLITAIAAPLVAVSVSDSVDTQIRHYDANSLIYPGSDFWIFVGIAVLGVIITALLSYIVEKKKTLEFEGQAITLPVLKWPVIIFLSVVLPLVTPLSTGNAANDYTEYYGMWNVLVGVGILVLGVVWQLFPKIARFWRERVVPRTRVRRAQ